MERIVGKTEKADHPFTVYTLGRICYQKNPEMFNKIAESMPEVNFVWIGDGEMRNQLTAMNIKITGWTERLDALKLSLNADVFLLTSRWEGLPISLLESMYMKKPCVVSNVIGNHDVIRDKRNGFLCNQIGNYIWAIEHIRQNGAASVVEEAYQDILNEYNTKVMAEKYGYIYEKNI